MKAKEMFEKTGWIQTRNDERFIQYEYETKYIRYILTFCIEERCIEIEPVGSYFVRLNSNDIKAINKQRRELQWVL